MSISHEKRKQLDDGVNNIFFFVSSILSVLRPLAAVNGDNDSSLILAVGESNPVNQTLVSKIGFRNGLKIPQAGHRALAEAAPSN